MIKKTLQAVLFTFFNKITGDMITFDYITQRWDGIKKAVGAVMTSPTAVGYISNSDC